MALLAGAMCGVRNDSCSRKHRYARTSHGMASESLSRGVDLFFAQEFCFFKQEHGPPRGSKQAKTDVLLTTVLGPLRCGRRETPAGRRRCGGGGGTPFPAPRSPRHGSVAVRASCALAAMEPAGVPGDDASPSALPPLSPGYCTHVPGIILRPSHRNFAWISENIPSHRLVIDL